MTSGETTFPFNSWPNVRCVVDRTDTSSFVNATAMKSLSTAVSATLVASCLALVCLSAPLQEEVLAVSWARNPDPDGRGEGRSGLVKDGEKDRKPRPEEGKKEGIDSIIPDEDVILEDQDFEDDDDYDEEMDLTEVRTNVIPLTHLHQRRGEILVPCFGMWWPVGGGYLPPPPVYDYGGGGGGDDYYGDYRRKRRRSKKQKKARMKKKKS